MKKIAASLKARLMWNSAVGELLTKLYDYRIFAKYRFAENRFRSRENYVAFITKQYHILEKGMALPDPRKGFGVAKITRLLEVVAEFEATYGRDELTDYVRAVIATYLQRNLPHLDPQFRNCLEVFSQDTAVPTSAAGVKHLSLPEIQQATDFDYESFVTSRTSVRNFSEQEVSVEEIHRAVELARHTPSVCNRQSWKAYLYGGETMHTLLKLQGGNQGFSQSISSLLVITTDIRKFTKMESNQVYVDGGLFAMSLVLALHHQHLASCCLNTCKPFTDENDIRQIAQIPESERVIMMIAVGHYREDFEVACSPKNSVDEILQIRIDTAAAVDPSKSY